MELSIAREVLGTNILIRKGNLKAKREGIPVSVRIKLDTKVYKF